MSAFICGLDVHRDSTYATIMDCGGKIVSQRRIVNDKVLSYLSDYQIDRIGMEASNQVAPLYRQLRKNGYDISVSHPKKTRYIAEAKIKSDRIDSKAIAELVRLNALPSAYMPDEETAKLREQVRRRAFLVRERVRLRVKIKSVLTYEGVKPPADYGLFTEKGMEWLHILDLEPVESYLRVITPLDDEIKLVSKELKTQATTDEDVKLLMTISGVGYYTALLIKSEVGDINRFSDGDKLCSYAGLVPSTHSSGNMTRHGSITRAYHRIAERRGRQVATVAAARKLLTCCYSVLKNKKPYHDQA